MQKTIETIMQKAHTEVKDYLMKVFPNLYFFISPTGNLSCWIRTQAGGDGTGIILKHSINVGEIMFHQWRELQELNKLVEPVRTSPKDFFYCTECGQVKPRSEYEDFVMAADYCKECAKNPQIAKLIEESHKAGFYD